MGLHIATAAIAAGYQVTLFNRGKTNPNLLPDAEHLVGNRDGNLQALKDRQWDVVIDVCGYLPRLVKASALLLKEQVSRYIFISTCSVYDEQITSTNANEGAPVVRLDDEKTETINDETYGGLKALCEKQVSDIYNSRSLVLRLGLVTGPNEKFVKRLHWIRRVALGGEILVPLANDKFFNFIDVRDVADFALLAVKKKLNGIYNLSGQKAMNLRSWLNACQAATQTAPTFVYINDHEFLKQSGVYDGIPFSARTEFLRCCSDKALRQGLKYRKMERTAADILAWNNTLILAEHGVLGLSLEREAELLAAYRERVKLQ